MNQTHSTPDSPARGACPVRSDHKSRSPSPSAAAGLLDLAGKTIAVIGAGKLGESLIQGLIDAQVFTPDRVIATATSRGRVDDLVARHGIHGTLDNNDAVARADIVIFAVKPQTIAAVLREVRHGFTPEKLAISVAASVSIAKIEAEIGEGIPVIRAMPNTPCLLQVGMTAVAGGRCVTPCQLNRAEAIFTAVGRCMVLEERHFDAVTGLSASGPAFIYIIIESLAEAGVKLGLPRNVATELVAQTVLGAAHMTLETGEHPALLKDQVTTPAGCTIDGILELEEGGLRTTLIKAVVKTTQRASELVNG